MNNIYRNTLRRDFLLRHQWGNAEILPLQPDASFRQYLRLRQGDKTAMLMDAPPPMENAEAFVTITRHLEEIGVRVPHIHATDIDSGFLLLEDLGDQTFTRLLASGHDEPALYRQAIDILSHINQHSSAADITLPEYNFDLALAEANLMLDWYLPARQLRPVEADARTAFARAWKEIFAAFPSLENTLVLRDYHVDNLMLKGKVCVLLDYQDAVIGSPAYDLASLLEDARRDISRSLVDDMIQLYLSHNSEIDRHSLHQHYMVWAAQRHCKVAGIFVRLWLRDGKDSYLQHLPRVMQLLQRHLHQPALKPLRCWLSEYLGELNHLPFSAPPEKLVDYCTTT